MEDIAEVAELERRRVGAINRQDLDALRALLADDYQHCHATAVVQTADQSVAHIAKNARTIKARQPEIRVYGDAAVLTGELVNLIERPGEEQLEMTLWVTQVVHRIAGEWKFVSFQATKRAGSSD
jgi:ketosteroid isomerase-like protein